MQFLESAKKFLHADKPDQSILEKGKKAALRELAS